ncbi:hypothetical protein RKD54_001877 [Pseudarthrobacter sp. SLBN-100]
MAFLVVGPVVSQVSTSCWEQVAHAAMAGNID